MRTAAVFALVAATGAFAQFPPVIQQFVGNLSSSCQQTLLQFALGSELSQCLHVQQAYPIIASAISSNTSLIPVMDQLTSLECGQNGCSNATLISAAQQLGTGCATDLAKYNVTNSTLRTIMAQYPLAREVVCLQTRIPYNETDAPLPITAPTFNVTNGTAYCTSSLLTEVSAKVGRNLSIPFFTDLFKAYQNNTLIATAQSYATKFNVTDICNDCIYGAADLVGVAYPGVANVTLASIGLKNITISGLPVSNVTVAQALNSTCIAQNYTFSVNGTLPPTVRLGAYNSSFTYNITAGAISTTGKNSSNPIRRNVADIKARWIGQQ